MFHQMRKCWIGAFATLIAIAAQSALASTMNFDGAIDVRVNAGELAERVRVQHGHALQRAKSAQRERNDAAWIALTARNPGTRMREAPSTGGVSALWNERGALTAAAPNASSESVVRRFLAEHDELFRLDAGDLAQLVVLGDSPGGRSGLRLLRIEQRVDGMPVFESETRFLIASDGRLWRMLGNLVPSAGRAAKFRREDLLSPAEALSSLFGWSGIALKTTQVDAKQQNAGWIELIAPAPVAGSASARLVLFPLAPGVLIPAWSLTVFTSGSEDWYALIDAHSGDLLWRRNMRDYASSQQARFGVYVQGDGTTPADSPAPQSPSLALPGSGTQYPAIARSTVNMLDAQNAAMSPNGWIDDCNGGENGCGITRGNNVHACLDTAPPAGICDAGALDASGSALGNPDVFGRLRDFVGVVPRDFEYTPAPLGGNPDAGDSPTNADSQRGAVVQAFYTINWFHDRVAELGFDEASGNFQYLNLLGQGGLDHDRVDAGVQSAGANTASFSTPADGAGPGRLSMSIHTGPAPDRDSALDAAIVIHELTHGMTHRLVGNSQGLLWDVARSMGEGWSDFYALALLNTTNADDPHARYPFAPWISYKLSALTDNYVYGYRRFPYSNDDAFNPLNFEDVDAVTADDAGGIAPSPLGLSARGALEVHNAGSIWASALWRVRAGIIANNDGADGDVTIGNETMLQLVTDALKMTPAHPSFIDGRDALIAADCATNACANEREIWEGFAAVGLGYRAVVPLAVGGRFALAHIGVGTSFALPHLDVVDPVVDVTIDDATIGNDNAQLDPGETVDLAVALTNPLHLPALAATGVTVTLATTSPDVLVVDSVASYADVLTQTTVSNVDDPFKISLRAEAICGSAIPFELKTVSSLGTRIVNFSLRVGQRNGVGGSLTYSDSPNLPIPVSSLDGVSADLNIVEDLEIADLNLRIDSLTHPLTGHLSVMLRAPNGYGSDLIFKRGAFMVPNQGPGANFVDLVIDDDLPIATAEDLNQSQSTQAPFTGDWLPAFNAPFWNTYRPSPPTPAAEVQRDAIGQLARVDGISSKGRWTLSVANGSATLPGTLDQWSLVVTPRSFGCTVFVPGDDMFADGFE